MMICRQIHDKNRLGIIFSRRLHNPLKTNEIFFRGPPSPPKHGNNKKDLVFTRNNNQLVVIARSASDAAIQFLRMVFIGGLLHYTRNDGARRRLTLPILTFCTIFFLSSTPVMAQDFGLSMHGTPKYSAEDAHLSYANPKAPTGGHLREAAIGTFDTLNPYSIKGKAAKGLNLVYDRLMARVWDEPFTMYPLIAQRVEVPKDRSSITIHINPAAKFHDGSAITADDVIFSFETLRESGRPNMRQIYKLVKNVEKRGELGVHFQLGEGFDRETIMIIAMMPVLSKQWWEGRKFDSTTLNTPNLNGPYRIKSVDAGRSITYERNPDYWATDLLTNVGHHNFENITYDYYRDDTVAFEAFKAGELDIRREWDMGKWASAYDFPRVSNDARRNIDRPVQAIADSDPLYGCDDSNTLKQDEPDYSTCDPKDAVRFSDAKTSEVMVKSFAHGRPERTKGFIFNTRRAPFDDINVRKALDLLFDFEWANQNLFHGRYKRIESFFPNSELAASGTPSPAELEILEPWKDTVSATVFGTAYKAPTANSRNEYRENLRKANALLNDAGWIVENGKRVKDGSVFDFEIMLSAPEDEKIALHFKRSLEKMGITVNIRVLDTAAYRGRLNEYDFDMTLYYWLSSLSPGTEQILYWGCDAAKQNGQWNFPGICDKAIDAISLSIASTQKREGLVAHMHALDRLLTHGHYMVPLYYAGTDQIAYGASIQPPKETPLYGLVQETWWMNSATR